MSGHQKYKSSYCDDKMSFQECELAILRHAVDETEKLNQQKIANSDEVKKMIDILEHFLMERKCVCYGGTAINNILPANDQFYNRDVDIPDYDFFSANALNDAKDLANIYYKAGYTDVEAKSGVHVGTYKVFVNFIPMADITEIHSELFKHIWKDSISIKGIHYAPPNFLRMNMFIELSRPAGDVSRWEKVLKRLSLLNKHYPLESPVDCQTVDFQRNMESHLEDSEKIYIAVRDAFIDQGLVFFGGYASSLYSKYMHENLRKKVQSIPDFDVLSENPLSSANVVQEKLKGMGIHGVKLIHRKPIGEIIPACVEIKVGVDSIAFIYEPIACHNYNTTTISGKEIRIATIDTILSFYLAFYYADAKYYYKERILCMAKFLFDVEQANRLEQRGLLKRFSIDCYKKRNKRI